MKENDNGMRKQKREANKQMTRKKDEKKRN